jgi:hypothetical protein
LAFHLARLESQKLKTDSMLLSNNKNLDTMLNIDPVQYLTERNSTVVQFLLGIEDKHVDIVTVFRMLIWPRVMHLTK